ncbi:hypothetical protein BC830DRAFT_1078506 [Chytriomyces sp. MP71]|nr:hypothetical protein BC830DRAFT_1078506 [Chytriomyces sp. MP71]
MLTLESFDIYKAEDKIESTFNKNTRDVFFNNKKRVITGITLFAPAGELLLAINADKEGNDIFDATILDDTPIDFSHHFDPSNLEDSPSAPSTLNADLTPVWSAKAIGKCALVATTEEVPPECVNTVKIATLYTKMQSMEAELSALHQARISAPADPAVPSPPSLLPKLKFNKPNLFSGKHADAEDFFMTAAYTSNFAPTRKEKAVKTPMVDDQVAATNVQPHEPSPLASLSTEECKCCCENNLCGYCGKSASDCRGAGDSHVEKGPKLMAKNPRSTQGKKA